MTTQDNGWPAFPCDQIIARDAKGRMQGVEISGPGMTLRDYFAAKAMQGLLSDSNVKASYKEFAERSYIIADAMLNERSAG